jgi:RNA-directed DNA polymerase
MPKTTMHDAGESEQAIVAKKLPNEGPRLLAWLPEEAVEPRACAKRNPQQQNTSRTQSRISDVPSELQRVRQRARQDKKARFTALLHHLTLQRLQAAFMRLKPKAAAGVDGVRWNEYAKGLEGNLQALHARLHRGGYRAKPSRRVYIPKADGKERPLGIASLEDKIVQGAVVELLNAVYEADFLGFSYGFRPGRSPHQALDALVVALRRKKVNWVLDADIRRFFDTIDHGWMQRFVQHRIGDQRVLRLIGKWLKAGVMEANQWQPTDEGTPQGAVISPLLANVYLHYVLDLWTNQWRKRHAQGDVVIVRYADDFIIGFQHRSDAERFHEVLRERLEKFSLQLHGEKTRLIEFGRYAMEHRKQRGEGKPQTFDFLGFTHICSRANWNGKFQIRRQSASRRKRAKIKAIAQELRKRRELSIAEQGAWLQGVLRGYYGYHAVPLNSRTLSNFRWQVLRRWYRSLCRRSHKKRLNWSKMTLHASLWLPLPRVQHPYPEERFFAAKTQGKSPVR